jgi:peptide/nickel transport system substrate-binding protein
MASGRLGAMRNSPAITQVALMAFCVTLLVACTTASNGQGRPTGSSKPRGTLQVLKTFELSTLDPMDSLGGPERQVYFNIYESLLGIDPKLNLIPGLAVAWQSPDPRTYVFSLRRGVKFQDGTDFNADAVKFNLDRYLTNPRSMRKTELASVDSIEVRDPLTVTLHLKYPDATLLAQLADRAGMVLSKDAISKGGADFSLNPVGAGTGPFEFVEWRRDDHLTVRKNPNYWRRGMPYLDQVIYRPSTNLTATFASLKTGAADVAIQISAKDVAAVKADPNLTYRDRPGLGFTGIMLNHGAAPFNDPDKARAVALAIDRAQIVRNVYQDVYTVARGPISPSSWAYTPVHTYDKPDLNMARSLGSGLSFELKVANTPDYIQAGQLIQGQLGKAGITVSLKVGDAGALFDDVMHHRFQASLSDWSGRLDPDGNTFMQFHTGTNFGSYSNRRVDALLETARAEGDRNKRKQLYSEAQRLIVDEVAWVFVMHSPAQQISSSHVHGFVLYPDGINRFAEVWKA